MTEVIDRAKKILPDSVYKSTKNLLKKTHLFKPLKAKLFVPNSYSTSTTYSVVSAVHNAAPYLEEFVNSILAQTLQQNKIELVLVDDGSTDNTAEILKDLHSRHSELITIVSKENGGQASARNEGLAVAQGDWITFIDSDDFVSENYFEEVDRAIHRYSNLKMIVTNLVFFKESTGKTSDTHPLNFRFKTNDSVFDIKSENRPIALSASSAFFVRDELLRQHRVFDTTIKPSFEDASFLNKYIIDCDNGLIAFLKKPRYYYRKRENGSSTIDTVWKTELQLTSHPKYGDLDLLRYANEQLGYIPKPIQQTIAYDLGWYFSYLTGHSERKSTYSPETISEFENTLFAIFGLIDNTAIMASNGGPINFEIKRAMISCFKSGTTEIEYVSIERFSEKRKTFLIASFDPNISVRKNGLPVEPIVKKVVNKHFVGTVSYEEYYSEYSFEKDSDLFSFQAGDNRAVFVSCRESSIEESASIGFMRSIFEKDWDKYQQHGDYWVLMDRFDKADDNAEHLYRYIAHNYPKQKIYYALKKTSPDWMRLEKEGFNLLEYGSPNHERILKGCSKIISSQADRFVHSYFNDDFYQSKDFVFLQHGITKDDLSAWLNPKPIDLFITATKPEYHSIVDDGGPYVFTKNQVALTGFPRHDELLKINESVPKKNRILIMPTWRNSLIGNFDKNGERALFPEFAESEYKKAWETLLLDPRLEDLSIKGYSVTFVPHPNILPYLEAGFFTVPKHIESYKSSNGISLQQYFAEACVLITDYSSVAFDVAILGKPCIYYQFDRESIFCGAHTTAQGYFDYERDAFGPICRTHNELMNELSALSDKDFAIEKKYLDRINDTFPFRDGSCCERVYQAIKQLDARQDSKYENTSIG